jgi:hypothetical protein
MKWWFPICFNVRWADIEALFVEQSATIAEREGSRIAVLLFGQGRSITARIPGQTPIKALLPASASGSNRTE